MSVAEAAHRPAHRGRAAKLWLGLIVLIAAGIGLAWAGTGSLRGETTASGLHIRTLEAGSGPYIQPTDGALVEYEGRLAADDTVIDSTEGRGPVPMIPTEMIPGFAEALSMMQEGGRYEIRIPAELAYGDSPRPGSPIPPNADLEFEVHIAQLIPNAALMVQQMRQQEAGPPVPEPQADPQRQP